MGKAENHGKETNMIKIMDVLSVNEFIEHVKVSGSLTEEKRDYIDLRDVQLIVDKFITNAPINHTDAFIEKACDAYCAVCDTKECQGCAECSWVIKFRKQLMKLL